MKAYDIINQLLRVLPSQTALFSDEVSISTLVNTSGTVTATTSSAHGLSTGDYVYVYGANRKTPISSLTRSGTTATATTSSDHDLTEVWHDSVEIIGATQAEYNGSHTLLSANNRRTFTFTVSGSPATPATTDDTIYLLEPWRVGYNGWVQVTVTGSTTFTYTSEDTTSSSAYGTMTIRKLPRISGALNLQRAIDSYTKFGQNKLWAFVVLGRVTASRDKRSISGGVANIGSGSSFRQNLTNDVSVYIFTPTKDTISGRFERDQMEDVAIYLYKTLLGKAYPTYLQDEPSTVLHFLYHDTAAWNLGFYVHEFVFQSISELTKNDVTEPEVTRAFRDLNLIQNNEEFGVSIIETLINLDDDPI